MTSSPYPQVTSSLTTDHQSSIVWWRGKAFIPELLGHLGNFLERYLQLFYHWLFWVVGLWGIVYSSFYFLSFLFFRNKHAYYKRNACIFELDSISLTFKLGPFITFIYKIEQIWKPRISGQTGQSCCNGSSMYRNSVPSVNARIFSAQESSVKGHTTPSTPTVLRKKNLIPLFENSWSPYLLKKVKTYM